MAAILISAGQQKLLQVARRQLGLDESTWRSVVERVTGQRSIRSLDQYAWGRLVDELARLGFRSTSGRRPFSSGPRNGMATNAQVALIRHLWREWAGADASDASLGRWLSRQGWCAALRFVSLDDAPLAIAALRAMVHRRRAAGNDYAASFPSTD